MAAGCSTGTIAGRGLSSVEAVAGIGGEVRLEDVGDVGACVKGLVFGLVEIGCVDDLKCGVCAGINVTGSIRQGEAGVPKEYFLDVLRRDQDAEIGVACRICRRNFPQSASRVKSGMRRGRGDLPFA